ncbi:MAG: PIN domain-containing protein [Acidobacteriaceae bacterium]
MLKPVAVLIDGGHLRVMAKKSEKNYVPVFIEQFSKKCVVHAEEELQRVLYYDCPPYNGTAKLPVSGTSHTFTPSAAWLD